MEKDQDNPTKPCTSKTSLADEELVEAVRTGDRTALFELDQRWRPRLLGLARSLSLDEHLAEDAAQVALWRAYLNLSRYDSGRPFEKWILQIGRNAALDLQRRRGREQDTDGAFQLEPSTPVCATGLDQLAGEEEIRALYACLASVDDDQGRTVVVLHDVIGMTLSAVGEVLGQHKNTVQYQRQKALRKLQKCMAEKGFVD